MSQKVAQVFSAHAACLHQAGDIINGYMHLPSTRQGPCECVYVWVTTGHPGPGKVDIE